MLDLIRLSRKRLFPPGGRELYHKIAILTHMEPGEEVLVAGCGSGITIEYFVREFGVVGAGVDEDPLLIQGAEARARRDGLSGSLNFQQGSMGDLPYRDGVFDVVVGELGLTSHEDPERAISELVRVCKPGGAVVLVQLVWKAPVEAERQRVLSEHLGARPLMLVELKRLLREGGVERIHTEAWSDEATAFRPSVTKPFPDFAELFSLPEKMAILRRAWARWGWTGVRTAVSRELEVHRLLTRERILGLDMLKGIKTGTTAGFLEDGSEEDAPSGRASSPEPPALAGAPGAAPSPRGTPHPEPGSSAPSTAVEGLPLFSSDP